MSTANLRGLLTAPAAAQLDSHEKALSRGRAEVLQLVDRLRIHPREDSADSAARLYALALQKNFTRGRRTSQVGSLPAAHKHVSAALSLCKAVA